jgi:3,4-dihydroxy 2-butanone 4-phosphate synthase/GTP cyclohydrolase II
MKDSLSRQATPPTRIPYDASDVLVPVDVALEEMRVGKMVILVDDEDRENEGDLCMAAEKCTPEAINFMAKYGRGLICLPMTEERLRQLRLSMMVPDAENTSSYGTAFTVSIEAREGVTTGISAADRATTVAVAIGDDARPQDIVRPGHIFPLRARNGGVLRRAGQTEGAVDLARMAGLKPAGVICEVMNDDGTMARMPDLVAFARRHGLKIVTVADLIQYRLRHETLVRRAAEAMLPTRDGGEFRAIVYENDIDHVDHIALVKGEILEDEEILVRVHSECLSGDAFGSMRCDCGEQLSAAMKMIEEEGRGVILYMRQEGRRPTPSRMARASTRSRPTRGSASPRTFATTASAPRSSSISVSGGCASSPTTPASAPGSRATVSPSSSGCPWRSRPTRRTSSISAPRKRSSGTSSTS